MASTTERGYGADHQRLRKQWAARLAAGATPPCPRCGRPVTQGMAWDLDHTDDRRGYHGPAHARCNRAAGGRRARRRTPRIITSRRW